MSKQRVIFMSVILVGVIGTESVKSQNIAKETVLAKDGKPIDFYFIKHGSVYFTYDDFVFYVDPVSYPNVDYTQLPKADYILITHDHYDHFDTNVVEIISKKTTTIICNEVVKNKLNRECTALKNGEGRGNTIVNGVITIEAFPAYNTTAGREIYHPKDRDNGYLVTVGGTCIYFAGDCEDMPEMKEIGSVDVAFLPVNQPYTMTVKQAINAAKMIKPKILFPYHYGDTDLKDLEVLNEKGIKVIIKPM